LAFKNIEPIRCYKAKRTVGFSPMAYNGRQLGDSSRRVGLQRGGYCAKLRLAAVFFSLIFSTLENKLKISLK